MSARDGGAAFPTPEAEYIDGPRYAGEGMSLRDYFAAKAMPMAWGAEDRAPTYGGTGGPSYRGVAERAYFMADAMLAAREDKA